MQFNKFLKSFAVVTVLGLQGTSLLAGAHLIFNENRTDFFSGKKFYELLKESPDGENYLRIVCLRSAVRGIVEESFYLYNDIEPSINIAQERGIPLLDPLTRRRVFQAVEFEFYGTSQSYPHRIYGDCSSYSKVPLSVEARRALFCLPHLMSRILGCRDSVFTDGH